MPVSNPEAGWPPCLSDASWLQGGPAGSLCVAPTRARGNPSFLITLLTFPVLFGPKDVLYLFLCSSHRSEYVRPECFSHPDSKHNSCCNGVQALTGDSLFGCFHREYQSRRLCSPELGEDPPRSYSPSFRAQTRVLQTADPRARCLPADFPPSRRSPISAVFLNLTQQNKKIGSKISFKIITNF